MSFTDLTAVEIARQIRSNGVKAEAVVSAFLERIAEWEPRLHAFNDVFVERALDDARAVDQKIARGETVGALAGVPIAIKDNLLIRGERCTCSSKILENYVAPYDATVISKL